jgi:hypothetical protein
MNRVPLRWRTVALLLVVTALIFGCGGIRQAAVKQQRTNQLKAIAIAYHNCNDQNLKGPANAAELQKFLEGFPDAVQAIQSGEIVVYWNAKVPTDFPKGTSNTVLAYDKVVPASGGVVVMGDGSPRVMTAAEFAAAPKPANSAGAAGDKP